MSECLFCTRTNLTKEHILSDWLSQILPRTRNHKETFQGFVNREGKRIFLDEASAPRIVDGAVHSKTAKCVCMDCNNTWMSRIVNGAKPWARQAILSEVFELDHVKQRQLSMWIGLSAVIADWEGMSTYKISKDDREHFRVHGVPPPNWTIFIGQYWGEEIVAVNQNSFPVFTEDRAGNRALISCLHNIATIMGSLYCIAHPVQAKGGLARPSDELWVDYHPFLVQIWPIKHELIR